MKRKEIEIGKVYVAKVSGRLCPVKILSLSQYDSRHWIAMNLKTKKQIFIKSAQRLRGEVEPVFRNGIRLWRAVKKG